MQKFHAIAFAALCAAAPVSMALAAEPASSALDATTRRNLDAAMHGEAYANLKYLLYAAKAREAGNEQLAALFEEAANVEANEHFAREADALGLVGSNEANLLDAMAGERYENEKMYASFATQADSVGDARVASLFRQIAEDEGDHHQQYQDAAAALRAAATAGK